MSILTELNSKKYREVYIITLLLVLFYFINQYLVNLRNNENSRKSKINKNKLVETFNSANPSVKKNEFYYNNFFIETNLDLVYLKDKYSLEKIIIANNQIEKIDKNDILVKANNYKNDDISLRVVKNTDWSKTYLKDNGIKCEGKCGCMKNSLDLNICGYKDNNKTFECPSVCSECNQCHQNENHIHLKFNSLCSKSKTLEDKEKCEMYRDRVALSKKTCFYKKKNGKDNKDNQNNKNNKNNANCEIFVKKDIKNNFSVKDDIFFRISLDYPKYKFKIQNRVNNIEIEKFLINEEDINYFIFYQDVEDLYIYIKPQTKDIGLSKVIYLEGKILFKDKRINTRDFKFKTVINIFDPEDKFIKSLEDDTPTFQEAVLKNKNNDVESYLFDNYSSNYLQESSINRCPLVKNHSVSNPLEDLKEGQYKRKRLIDNPTTWKERIDINRPWISTL